MTSLWTWSGKCFGYRNFDELWTQGGKHVGRFHDEEVYGTDGRYLGEIRSDNRLITNRAKKSKRRSPFTPLGRRTPHVRFVGYVGYVMYAGYEDFPSAESFN